MNGKTTETDEEIYIFVSKNNSWRVNVVSFDMVLHIYPYHI